MKITIEYLTGEFQRFNRDYFENGLPLPRLVLSRSKTRLGSFACQRKLTWKGYRLSHFTIRISTYYNMSERQVQNILLHEMIHYSIAYRGLKDSSAHGIVFRGMMEVLNHKHGWEITVTQNTKGWELSEQARQRVNRRPKAWLVLAMRTSNGRCFLSVVNPKFQQRLETQIKRVPDIVFHQWFQSDDEYFADFPAVRSLRGRRVPLSLFEEKIKC